MGTGTVEAVSADLCFLILGGQDQRQRAHLQGTIRFGRSTYEGLRAIPDDEVALNGPQVLDAKIAAPVTSDLNRYHLATRTISIAGRTSMGREVLVIAHNHPYATPERILSEIEQREAARKFLYGTELGVLSDEELQAIMAHEDGRPKTGEKSVYVLPSKDLHESKMMSYSEAARDTELTALFCGQERLMRLLDWHQNVWLKAKLADAAPYAEKLSKELPFWVAKNHGYSAFSPGKEDLYRAGHNVWTFLTFGCDASHEFASASTPLHTMPRCSAGGSSTVDNFVSVKKAAIEELFN